MTPTSTYRGAIGPLLRERRVLALLGLLLLMLPALAGPAISGMAGHGDAFAICSATGVAVPGDAGSTDTHHDGLACCGTLCHNATALTDGDGAPRLFARLSHPLLQAIPRERALSAFLFAHTPSIRAPPVAAA